VAAGFTELMRRDPGRWRSLSAEQPVDVIAEAIFREIEPLLQYVSPLRTHG